MAGQSAFATAFARELRIRRCLSSLTVGLVTLNVHSAAAWGNLAPNETLAVESAG